MNSRCIEDLSVKKKKKKIINILEENKIDIYEILGKDFLSTILNPKTIKEKKLTFTD